jgi:hypothetical protein
MLRAGNHDGFSSAFEAVYIVPWDIVSSMSLKGRHAIGNHRKYIKKETLARLASRRNHLKLPYQETMLLL